MESYWQILSYKQYAIICVLELLLILRVRGRVMGSNSRKEELYEVGSERMQLWIRVGTVTGDEGCV